MKAVRLFQIDQPPRLVDVPEPTISGPMDVIVRIAGAGVCRTDLHLVQGVFDAIRGKLPFTLGHENAGWIQAVGTGVSNLAPGDPVILHPQPSCGLCAACRAGNDMHCTGGSFFPGFDGTDGGYAEYLRTSARAVVKLAPGTDPASLAPFADAGITAYHAVKKVLPRISPGTTVAVVGIGGLGHFGVQILTCVLGTSAHCVKAVSEGWTSASPTLAVACRRTPAVNPVCVCEATMLPQSDQFLIGCYLARTCHGLDGCGPLEQHRHALNAQLPVCASNCYVPFGCKGWCHFSECRTASILKKKLARVRIVGWFEQLRPVSVHRQLE
ncbi:MAG: alcohol dehydrogenase catalytic domain-containing protein [Chloroflexi bacterium]|nr:alcohol dehydrogenase catalytic domain-containing protein [Chloroflexota bacterium]